MQFSAVEQKQKRFFTGWRNKVTGEGEKGIIALLNDVIGNLLWNLQ